MEILKYNNQPQQLNLNVSLKLIEEAHCFYEQPSLLFLQPEEGYLAFIVL